MTMPYLNSWDTKEEMIADWEGNSGFLTFEEINQYLHVDVLLASYVQSGYEGSAFVLFRDTRDNKLYENYGSHCSCYGLENQWEPTEVNLPSLKHRVMSGGLGDKFDGEGGFKEEIIKVITELEGSLPAPMVRWIKIPDPGELRGEGRWHEFDKLWPNYDEQWKDLMKTQYLPSKELPSGEEP